MCEPAIFDTVIVTYRAQKQILHPWEVGADLQFMLGGDISTRDCIPLHKDSIQDLVDILAFPIPRRASVYINGEKADWKSQWKPGDRIEFRKPSRRKGARGSNETIQDGSMLAKPRWDKERRELWVGDCLVKRLKRPAQNQERILTTFQEEDWPSSIDDPIPPGKDDDGNSLEPKQRLNDTISSLNKDHDIDVIHFRGDGTGERVIWELRSRQ